MNIYKPKAYFLDFYGTLVEEDDEVISDICKLIAQEADVSISEIAQYWSSIFTDMCNSSHGTSFKLQKELESLSLKDVLNKFKVSLDVDELSELIIEYWKKPIIFPETKQFLSKINIPICLLSNIDNQELQSALSHIGLSFNYIVTSEDCKAYKPRQEMFDFALSKLNLDSQEVLHIGDSFSADVIGAKNSGIQVAWINRKNKPSRNGIEPEYNLRDLIELLSLI